MGDFIFNVKGLTAQDRAQWEKDNIEKLKELNYTDYSEDRKDRFFKNASFKNKFSKRQDYQDLVKMSPTQRDSLFNISPDENVENMQKYQSTLQTAEESLNNRLTNTGKFIGSANKEWEAFDKKARELSSYYNRYAGTEFLPLENEEKIDLMSSYEADLQYFGEEIANKKLSDRIKTTVSENQPLLDKASKAIGGMGAQIVGGTLSGIGMIVGGLAGATGLSHLLGENDKSLNYFQNIGKQAYNNPFSRYGNKVTQQGTLFVSDDPEQQYDRTEIIRTAAEDEHLYDYVFSTNTIFDLVKNGGFTVASMLEGAGLVSLGNRLFNTAKAATAAGKLGIAANNTEKINKTLSMLNNMQRGYNATIVPGLVGTAEGAFNALDTEISILNEFNQSIESYIQNTINSEIEANPELYQSEEAKLRLSMGIKEAIENSQEYKDIMEKAEHNASIAALNNFTINSFINGFINKYLQSAMFGPKVQEAIKRTKVGKLFSTDKFTTNANGDIIANTLSKKKAFSLAALESLGEGVEEYSQTISDEFSKGGARNDFYNYMTQRFNGVADEAISESLADNLGAAFAAAGKAALSKEAIQSGIMGALGQMIGTPNVNALLSKSTYTDWKNKSKGEKLNSIYRIPFLEAYYNNKTENKNREASAKALNDWLNTDNNKEKLTSIKGAIGWMDSLSKAEEDGDEFSYRNSNLGKMINSYFMLEHLKETPYYSSFVNSAMEILNIPEESEDASKLEQQYNKSIQDIKKDTQYMLDTMKKVQEATAELEKNFGNSIPQEVKESLIYGKLSIKDWDMRSEQLENEIKSVIGNNTITSNLTDRQKQFIATHGSLNIENPYNNAYNKIQEKIKSLEANKDILSNTQKSELKQLKKTLKDIKKKEEDFFKETKYLQEGNPENEVLSSNDILNLNPEERYIMLNPENKKHYSEEQQQIIEKLIEKGNLEYTDFMNKIEDAARIYQAKEEYLTQYNEALKNPEILSTINGFLKYKSALDDKKKEYRKIGEIKDYKQFTDAVDNILFKGNEQDIELLNNELKDNVFYQKYLETEKLIDNLYNRLSNNPAFENLSESDMNLVAITTKYLAREGVDISDYDKAISTLFSTDESGTLRLTNLINEYNNKVNPNERVSMDNFKVVIDAYKKALESYKKNEQTKAEVEKKPEATSTQPVTPTNGLTGIFGGTATTDVNALDAGRIDDSKESKENNEFEEQSQAQPDLGIFGGIATSEPKGDAMSVESLLSDDFINNNSETPNIIAEAENIINKINNSSSMFTNEDKQKAIEEFTKAIDKGIYNSEEELHEVINSLADTFKSQVKEGGDINERLFSLYKQLDSRKTQNQKKIERKEINNKDNKETKPLEGKESIILPDINESYKGPIGERFKSWGISDYIRAGKLSRGPSGSTIYYTTLEDLNEDVKNSMNASNTPYEVEEHMPIVALVKDDNGPIKINNVSYQPIGILPSSSKNESAKILRKLAIEQGPNKILTNNNTKVTSAVLVVSPPIVTSNSKENDKDFNTLIYEDLTQEEKALIDNPNESNKLIRMSIYEKRVKKIAERLRPEKDAKGKSVLYYWLPSMKGDKSSTKITVITKSFEESTNSKGESLTSVLNSNNSKSIINFNSRTREFAKALSNILKHNTSNITSNGIEFTSDDATVKYLKKIPGILNRYIYTSSDEYNIKPYINNGTLGIDLYLGDEKLGTIINDVKNPDINLQENIANILHNLIKPGTTFRDNLNWQVDKDESFYDPNSKFYNKENVENLIKDNILRVGVDRLEREISGIELSIPTAIKSTLNSNKQTITNSENADTKVQTTINNKGLEVDSDTGITSKGTISQNKVQNDAVNKAKKIISNIIEDSKKLELSKDNKTYQNTVLGIQYARVTSVIQADENAEGRFETLIDDGKGNLIENPWILPSTNIGTTVDEFVRDFFAGKIYKAKSGMWRHKKSGIGNSLSDEDSILSDDITDLSIFPNADIYQWIEFAEQLQTLKNYFDSNGFTIVPRDVTVSGKVQVINEQGVIEELNTAGTIDLLAYDTYGNFHVFDMKTHHSTITADKEAKYTRQLSLYKKFLEDTYDITVSSVGIIPIKVEYPNPSKLNKYTQGPGNSILLNGNKYEGAKPKLFPIKLETPVEVKIDYNKLTEEEKELLSTNNQSKVSKETNTSTKTVSSSGRVRNNRKPRNSEKKGTPIKIEDNIIGTNFNDLTESQKESLINKYKDIIDIEDYFNNLTEDEKKHELDCIS